MTDRELIIDALRDYEQKAERCKIASGKYARQDKRELTDTEREFETLWRSREEGALRIRAELEDNPLYLVAGGSE